MNTQLRSDSTGQSKEPGCSTTDFTYDKLSKVFICANEKALFTTYEKDSKLEPSARLYRQSLDIPEEYIQAQGQQHIPSRFENENSSGCGIESYIDYTRFSTSKSSQQGIAVSASGLSVTCKGTKSVNSSLGGYSYAIGCKSFEQNSEYYVEMFLPNGCEGVELGVVLTPANLEAPQFLKTYLVTYKYKTAKTIGLKIDTKQWGIKVWMNGVYEPFKAKRIPKGSYALCLKMNLQGVTCIINPYAQDPERTVSPFMLAPSSYSLQQQPQSADNSVQELLLKLNQALIAVDAKQQARKDINNEQTDSKQNSPSKNLSLNEIIYLQESSNLIAVHDNKIKLLRRNTQGKFDLHYSHFLNKPSAASDTIYLPISLQAIAIILNCQHLFAQIPSNLSTIFLQALLKAVSSQTQSDEESQTVTITAPFNVIKSTINAGIYVVYSHVSQLLELVSPAVRHPLPAEIKKETQKLIGLQNSSGFDLSSTPSQDEPSDGLPFFPQKALLLAKDEEPVSAAGVEKDVPSAIASVSPKIKAPAEMTNEITNIESEDSIKKEATSSSNNNNSNSLSNHSAASELTSQDIPIANIKELNEKWDLKQLQDLLIVLQRIDEQLFAMTLHEDVSVELRKGFQTGAARVFSSFGRLLSFYTSASSVLSLERLAEAGLVNIYDLKSELRHFLDLNTPVRISRESENNSVEDQIESQLDLHAASSANIVRDPNITLDITVNAAPYGIHKNADNSSPATGVSILRPSNQYRSNYVCTMGSEGTVNIWNARFMLQRLAISDFKSEFVYPSQCEIQADLRQNEDALNSSKAGLSSNSNAFQSYLYKILENSISDSCKYAKKPKPTEKQLSADSDKVEHLLQLGFSISVAKKACIEVKNESLEKAVDAALRIKEEEMKQTKPANQKGSLFFSGEDQEEIHVNSIKPFWSCELCTYQNTGEHFQCEVCLFQAPESAYYSQIEVEVIMNERKQQKELEEQKALQEILQKEEEESRIKEQAQELVKEQKLKEQLKNEQIKSFINSAAARNGFILNTADPSFAQLLVGVALNLSEKSKESLNVALEHKSLLRIRRFATNPKALNQFYSFTEKGIVSNISGQYLQESSVKGLEKLLLADENNRFVFESLAPLAAENASLHELLAVQEANIFFDDDTIIDSKCRLVSKSSSTEEYELVILGASTSNSYNLHVYSLKIDTQDIYNLSKKPIETTFIRKIRVGGSNTASESASLVLAESSSAAVIVAGTKLIQIPLSNSSSETIQIQELNSRAVTTCFVSGNQIAVLDESSAITLIPDFSAASNEKKDSIIQPSIPVSLGDQTIDIAQLKAMTKNLYSQDLGCYSVSSTPNESTNYDATSSLRSSHSFVLLSANDASSEVSQKFFEFEFPSPVFTKEIILEFAQRRNNNLLAINENTNNSLSTHQNDSPQANQHKPFSFELWEPVKCQLQKLHEQSQSAQQLSSSDAASEQQQQRQPTFLPLAIQSYSGSPSSTKQIPSAVLFRGQQSFTSSESSCSFILKHARNEYMIIDSVTMDSSVKVQGNALSVETVLIFTSNNIYQLAEAAKKFSKITGESAYLSWKENQKGAQPQENEPIACVSFYDQEQSKTVALPPRKPMQYLMVLPIKLRNNSQSSSNSSKDIKMDSKCQVFQFIGLQGFSVKRVQNTKQSLKQRSNLTTDANKNIKEIIKSIEVRNAISGEWQEISVSSAEIQEVDKFKNAQIINEIVQKNKNQKSVDFENNKSIELNIEPACSFPVSRVRVTLASSTPKSFSQISFTSKGAVAILGSKQNQDLAISEEQIKLTMIPKLFSLLVNPSSQQDFNQIVNFLIAFISSQKLESTKETIFASFDIQNFIRICILTNANSDFTQHYNLFTCFENCKTFKDQLFAALLELLPVVITRSVPVSESGLRIFLSLLHWCDSKENSSKIFSPLLKALQTLAKTISEKREPAYNVLTSRFQQHSLCFEQSLFSRIFLSPQTLSSKQKPLAEFKKNHSNLISYGIQNTEDSLVRQMYIDLGQPCDISELSLIFEKNTSQAPSFRIHAWWFTTENEKKLLLQEDFGAETFAQLANFSQSTQCADPSEDSSSLLIFKGDEQSLPLTSRYLLIQIGFSLMSSIGTNNQYNERPNTLITPLISGKHANSSKQLVRPDIFPQNFDEHKKTFDQYLESSHYNTESAKPSISPAGVAITESNLLEPQDKKSLLEDPEQLEMAQNELRNSVETISQEDSEKQIQLIEQMQLQRLDSKECSLSYLQTVAYSLSKLLRRISSDWPSSDGEVGVENIRTIVSDIFESFVIFGGRILSDEILSLLDEVLIDKLSEKEWLQFVFAILKKYLMHKHKTPLLFSQKNLICALDKISIPLGEVLAFLATQLSIPISGVIPEKIEREITYESLAPTLALLSAGFNRIPKMDISQRAAKAREGGNANPNKLAQVLDPLSLRLTKSVRRELERIKKPTPGNQVQDENIDDDDEEDLKPPGVKRSVSHPLKREVFGEEKETNKDVVENNNANNNSNNNNTDGLVELDSDESFAVALQVCAWVAEHREKFPEEHEFLQLMRLCFHLLDLTASLSSMAGLKKTLASASEQPNSLFKLIFHVLATNDEFILSQLSGFMQSLASPSSFNSISFTSLPPSERALIEPEKQCLDDIQLILAFNIEQILQWILEFTADPLSSKRNIHVSSIMQTYLKQVSKSHGDSPVNKQLEPSKWVNHIEFTMQLLHDLCKIIQDQFKSTKRSKDSNSASLQTPQRRPLRGNSSRPKKFSTLPEEHEEDEEGSETKAEQQRNQKSSDIPENHQNQLSAQEKQQHIRQAQPLTPVGITRSMSVPVSHQPQSQRDTQPQLLMSDFIERCNQEQSCAVSSQTLTNLLNLLENNSSPNSQFSSSSSVWALVFQLFGQMRLSSVLASRAFERIAAVFFNKNYSNTSHSANGYALHSSNLPQLLLANCQQFLQLTQTLFAQKECPSDHARFSTLLLSLIFAQLAQINSNSQSVSSSFASQNLQSSPQRSLILTGWLDILLTGQTPKPESYYQPSTEQLLPQSSLSLTLQCLSQTLNNASSYLLKQCTYGGVKGIEISEYSDLFQLQCISTILALFPRVQLVQSNNHNHYFIHDVSHYSSTNANPMNQLFASNDSTIIAQTTSSIANLIKWYIFNQSKDQQNSPATTSVSKISLQIIKIFISTKEYPSIAKIFLRELINICRELDRAVFKHLDVGTLNGIMASQFAENANNLFDEMFDLLVSNDEIASFVSFEVEGFKFLLEKMGLDRSAAKQVKESSSNANSENNNNTNNSIDQQSTASRRFFKNEIASFIDKSILSGQPKPVKKNNGIAATADINSSQKEKITPPFQVSAASVLPLKIQPEEHALKAKFIKSGMQIWNGTPANWSEHKAGVPKMNLVWTQMNGASHLQCSITLELESKIHLSNVRIGFNTFWNEVDDKVFGVPTAVLLEVTSDLSKPFVPLAQLPLIDDAGYESHRVKVAAKNFERLAYNEQGGIPQLLRQNDISNEVRYVRFVMCRPVVNFIENGSLLQSKLYENIAVSISFISIMGCKSESLDLQSLSKKIQLEQESSAIKLIGKLCNQSFANTLLKIANNELILEIIQKHFQVISTLLPSNEQSLAPVFLAIAGNNQSMGDWILGQFLDLSKGPSHAKIVREIVCSQLSYTHKRIQKVHDFLFGSAIKEILELTALKNKFKATFKYLTLRPFIETWATAIQISAQDFITKSEITAQTTGTQKQQMNAITSAPIDQASAAAPQEIINCMQLSISEENISNIIDLYSALYGASKYKLIVKVLVSALNLPAPYMLSDNSTSAHEAELREKLLKSTLEKLLEKAKVESKFFELLAPLILSSSKGIQWILENDHRRLLQLFGQLLNLLKSKQTAASATQNTALFDQINFLSEITLNPLIQAAIAHSKSHINFYNCLKDSNKSSPVLLKPFFDPSIISLVVEILKNVALSSAEESLTFAKILCEDIKLLTTKRDMIFVSNLLVPLLNSEKMLSVAFHPFDQISNKWLAEGKTILDYKRERKNQLPALSKTSFIQAKNDIQTKQQSTSLLSQTQKLQQTQTQTKPILYSPNDPSGLAKQALISSLTTKLFWKEEHKKAFFQNFEAFSKKTQLNAKISQPISMSVEKPEDKSKSPQQLYYQWHLEVVQEKDSDESILEEVREKVLKQGNFLIILTGTNQDQKCVSGVFGSAKMQAETIESIQGEIQNIPRSNDDFLFYYEEDFQMHFDVPADSTKQLGILNLSGNAGIGLSIQCQDNERIFISYHASAQSMVDINLSEMTPIDTDTSKFPKDVPADFELTRVEYWLLKPAQLTQSVKIQDNSSLLLAEQAMGADQLLSNLQSNLIFSPMIITSAGIANYFRIVPVYSIPENLDFDNILNLISVGGYWLSAKGKEELSFRLRQDRNRVYNLQNKAAKISELLADGASEDGVIDLEFDALKLYENCYELQNPIVNLATYSIDVLPSKPIFEMFQNEGGVQQIIEVVQASLSCWKNAARAAKWQQYMKELKSFSTLPKYFSLFMKNKECIELLFELLAGLPDEIAATNLTEEQLKKAPGTNANQPFDLNNSAAGGNTTITSTTTTTTNQTVSQTKEKLNPGGSKKWDEEEQKAVNYSYSVLKDTFKLGQDNTVREAALENKLIEAILDRIALISKEIKRTFVEHKPDTVEEEPDSLFETKLEKKDSEDDGKKKIAAKKGTGYGSDNTGQNQKWNTSEYLESKKARSESLQNLIAILEAFLDFKDWNPPKILIEQIMSSALLPLVESSLRSGSLLEMSKDKDLVFTYLSLIRVMAKNSSLVPLLLPLDPRYIPKQTDSILSLTLALRGTANIFLNCMVGKNEPKEKLDQQEEETENSKKLAEELISTYEILSAACSHYEEEDNSQQAISAVLAQPLSVKYKILLKDLRFDYSSFKKETGKYKHHYSSNISTTYSPSQAKMVRLAQELADLATALPIDHTNSIFVRCDSERFDVMKCMVMGAKGTPYAHGAFIFDVYFGDDYPNGPPKCNLETTGAGKVRFNPNLYACGKVCLSLLGTWRGNASENWDPKISTLLQILVSLQAIIMSEDVYFNEPGFEGEQGTEEGEKKNEAYSNIVRYCNIKYAMIEQIKNPPEGFEAVVLRHFYLKKEEILEECQKWIKYADVRQAAYTGLVNDHNNQWCTDFKGKYPQMLREAVSELEEVLNQIPAPSLADLNSKQKDTKKTAKKDKVKEKEVIDIMQGVAKFEDIDVNYDDEDEEVDSKEKQTNNHEAIDINDEKVKDRWSRYIGAMGIDAVAKQSKCSLFLSGLGSLGVEIAKNLVMSGLKRITLHDSKKTTFVDLAGQFYLGEEDIGKNRAEQSLKKIRQLNHYVKVDTAMLNEELPNTEELLVEKLHLNEYDIVVLTDVSSFETQIAIDRFCRSRGIKFISADVLGPWCRLFTDFGEEFEVADKNGEDPVEVMIKSISCGERGVVTLLPGGKHPYEDGEHVVFSEIQGMDKIVEKNQEENKEVDVTDGEQEMELEKPTKKDKSTENKLKDESVANKDDNNAVSTSTGCFNGTIHKIKVINSNSFEIGDTRQYTNYIRNGVAKNIKTPVMMKFKSLAETSAAKTTNDIPFDANMQIHDFEKIDNPLILFVAFKTLDKFKAAHHNALPACWNYNDTKEFLQLAESEVSQYFPDEASRPKQLHGILLRFACTVASNVGPFAAFMGGFVSQEIVKSITHKYLPTNQLFFSDCMEVIPGSEDLTASNIEGFINSKYDSEFKQQNTREDGIRFAVGNTLLKQLNLCNIFMVGCGAIGCELLKNFAMISLGTGTNTENNQKGLITITDPDHIEVSNLNRQFLFREKHLHKPKSQTAAASAIQMNPLLNGHIHPRLDKVFDGTVNIFSDKFFGSLNLVANALDNVQARKYVDQRCVTNKKPLLESGTLGPKGHVQVVLPFITESYGSQQDPQEEGEIPHCTLKMFPEETLHCVEWARDKFGKLFTLRSKSVLKILEETNYDPQGGQELKELKEVIKMLEKRPKDFKDCIDYAVRKFYKYYRNDIKQLIYTYPLDSKTKDGEPFWKLPKRPPTEYSFDPTNQLHRDFVSAFAMLRAKIYKIDYPKNCRSDEEKKKIAEIASQIIIPAFKASDEKALSISSEVKAAKNEKPKEGDDAEEDPDNQAALIEDAIGVTHTQGSNSNEKQEFLKKLETFKNQFKGQDQPMVAEEFEKDEDDNGHIDLIYALANCRSASYKLAPMDWIQVKIKAGRIVPALATTTATVAGLQTIELIKIVKNEKLSNMKNAFLNLAVPLLQLTEPQVAEKIKIHENLSVTLWDRWEVSLGVNVTLKQIFSYLTEKYQLIVSDVMTGSKLLYSSAIMDLAGKEAEKEKILTANLVDLIDTDADYVDFIFAFTNLKGEKVKQTPLVRVKFQ